MLSIARDNKLFTAKRGDSIMKEETLKKINKIGKISTIITKIMKIFLIIGLIGSIIGSIAVAVLPDNLFSLTLAGEAGVNINVSKFGVIFLEKDKQEIKNNLLDDTSNLSIDGIEYMIDDVAVGDSDFEFNASARTRTITFDEVLGMLVIAVALIVLSLVTVIFAEGLCKAFRDCVSPFEENVINKMQNLAIALIPWAVFKTFSQSIIRGFYTGKFTILLGIDISVVFVVLIILVLVKIFKYGAMLQAESDETL